jgi:hypothetical protein
VRLSSEIDGFGALAELAVFAAANFAAALVASSGDGGRDITFIAIALATEGSSRSFT